jgi:hypothetical protein
MTPISYKFHKRLSNLADSLKRTIDPIGGTFLILLANPDSHFSTPGSIYIIDIIGNSGLFSLDSSLRWNDSQ